MLSCEGLSKSFGALAAVRDITLEIPLGERHAVIGPNGAGKTTLFNLICGVIRADIGDIRLDGKDLESLASGAPHAAWPEPQLSTQLVLSRHDSCGEPDGRSRVG